MSNQKDWMNRLMKNYTIPNPYKQEQIKQRRILNEQQIKQIKQKDS
jgi:hypothetical protein